jgi:hypothetical protein
LRLEFSWGFYFLPAAVVAETKRAEEICNSLLDALILKLGSLDATLGAREGGFACLAKAMSFEA